MIMLRIMTFASSGGALERRWLGLHGADLISSSETPSFFQQVLDLWILGKMTPIEPVIELSPATIVSPAAAIM